MGERRFLRVLLAIGHRTSGQARSSLVQAGDKELVRHLIFGNVVPLAFTGTRCIGWVGT